MNGLKLYLAIKQESPQAVSIMISGADAEFEAVLAILACITSRQAANHFRKPMADGP